MKIIKSYRGEDILIDNKDFKLLPKYTLSVLYRDKIPTTVMVRVKNKRIPIGRFLLKPPKNKYIDHINGNPLDNRRKNIRICTPQQNMWNTKISKRNYLKIKGVFISSRVKNKKGEIVYYYKTELFIKGKRYFKNSKNLNECIKFREKMEKKFHKEFRRSNLIHLS